MPKKILIVDDEKDFVDLLEKRLSLRYEIFTASNGQEGLEVALSKKPDLILSDLLMPKMNGYELVRTLKKHVETEHIPVLMLTGVEDTRSIYQAQESGVSDYLIKPMHLDELPGMIEKYIFE